MTIENIANRYLSTMLSII